MVDFNRKRLQVFVSSTYTDLIDERQAAVEAILSHGHIPAGMELFTSGDESQMDVIKQWIEDEDIKDIKIIVGETLGTFARREDLVGWVRADQVTVNPAIAEEMARLSKENEQLRNRIENSSPTEELINGLSFAELKKLLEEQNLFEKLNFDKHWNNIRGQYLAPIISMGLLELDPDNSSFCRVSEAGIKFLNKRKLESLKPKKDSENNT